MKIVGKSLLAVSMTIALSAVGLTGASAMEADSVTKPDLVTITVPRVGSDQSLAINAIGAGEAATLDELIAAINPERQTFDQRLVSAAVLESEAGQAFRQAVLAQGASVITAEDSIRHPPTAEKRTADGRIWSDFWGLHFTASAQVIGQLVAAASGLGASAAAVAGVLALNIEGFPLSTGGAMTGGIIAASLFASAGILSLCNVGGNGAQFNYNWVTWTCWPL